MVVTLIELNGVLGCDNVARVRNRPRDVDPARRLVLDGFRPAEMRTLHPFGKLLSARPLGRLVQPRNLWVLRPSRFREPLMMNFSDLSGEPNLAGA